MAETQNMWTPPILDLSVDRYAAWKIWKSRWDDYSIVTGLNEKAPAYQCSMLRYAFSEETRKIYEALTLSENDKKDIKVIIKAIETFARGIVNETLEQHNFNNRNQEEGEKFDDFLTDLKTLSKNCNFCDTCHNGLIRDRIVGGINDNKLRKKLLSESNLTLTKTEDLCRAHEKAIEGVETMKKPVEKPQDIDYVRQQQQRFKPRETYKGRRNSTPPTMPCKFCV